MFAAGQRIGKRRGWIHSEKSRTASGPPNYTMHIGRPGSGLQQKKVPLFFAGYSLGGLLGCELQVSRPDVHFDRMVLFAPSLRITAKPYLLKALMPFPNLVLDSLSPETYRTNDGTPMAGYKALFDALDRFEKNMNGKLNVPTLVFHGSQRRIHLL